MNTLVGCKRGRLPSDTYNISSDVSFTLKMEEEL